MDEFWTEVERHHETMVAEGEFDRRRADQQAEWTWSMVREELLARLTERESVANVAKDVIAEVKDGSLTATLAAGQILDAYDDSADDASDARLT